MKNFFFLMLMVSPSLFAKSIECQILKEKIISEVRYLEAQKQSSQQSYNKGYRAGQDPLAGIMGNIAEFSANTNKGLSEGLGLNESLEQKISIYKSKCE